MNRQPPASRVGAYHVLDCVGAGGMGVVFRAVHAQNGRVAAVKFLSNEGLQSPKSRERFAHEARVQASLKHPSLAAFYEWHEINGVPCIVMEWVDGATLSERIRAGGALPLEEATQIFGRIVEAIGWMHERGVIHRDIKSGNVKINARGEVKLLDFGIAKTGGAPKLTQTGAFVGTLQYLSPEQIKGAKADQRSDIWALGVLFYEMLGGRVPFDAPTLGELLEQVSRAAYPPLRELRPEVPRAAEQIVRRCLQKSPQARYQNAASLSADLAALNQNAAPRAIFSARNAALAGVLSVAVIVGFLLLRAPQAPDFQPLENAVTPILSDIKLPPDLLSAVPTATPPQSKAQTEAASEGKTITIDVFNDAAQTQVWRDGELLGPAPMPVRARIGQEVEITLKRPGFQTRRETITVSASRAVYTFDMERVDGEN